MRTHLAVLGVLAAIVLGSCASPSSRQASGTSGSAKKAAVKSTAQARPAGNVGIIELFPDGVLTRHKYGTLAGISYSHHYYEYSLNVGEILRDSLVRDINAKGTRKAVAIPTSGNLQQSQVRPRAWANPKGAPSVPELFDTKSTFGFNREHFVAPQFHSELRAYGEKYGVGSILFIRPMTSSPYETPHYPPGYNYGIFTQDILGPTDLKVIFLFGAGLLVDLADMRLKMFAMNTENAVSAPNLKLEDVSMPEAAYLDKTLNDLIKKLSAALASCLEVEKFECMQVQ